MAERTRWKCNGAPVHITKDGSVTYRRRDGSIGEVFGHAPIVQLAEQENVLDETGHNIRCIQKWSVGWRFVDPALDGVPSPDCFCAACQSIVPPPGFRR